MNSDLDRLAAAMFRTFCPLRVRAQGGGVSQGQRPPSPSGARLRNRYPACSMIRDESFSQAVG